MKRQKIEFRKLIGNHYPIEVKMEVLNWMLATGKKHRQQFGKWNVIGISQAIIGFSGNDHEKAACVLNAEDYNQFFDAAFARAILKTENKALKEWRIAENVRADSFRMLVFPETKNKAEEAWRLIGLINLCCGKLLQKQYAHPYFPDRTVPKITGVRIFTTGGGWVVRCNFSFLEFDYENGWFFEFRQSEDQSVVDFLNESLLKIDERLLK